VNKPARAQASSEHVSAQEILRRNNIAYVATTKKSYTTNCPNCSEGYLNVKIDRDGVAWYCHHCEEGGGEKFEQGKKASSALGPIKAIFDYTDESGALLFQALRYEPVGRPKEFRQRTGPDQEIWSLKGVRIVPFMLPELMEDVSNERTIFIVEGEKDVLTLRKHNVPATCNPMGAGNWWSEFNEIFRGADVVICGDNDEPGRKHVALVARNLYGVAGRVRVLDLKAFWPEIEESDDITDWFAAGHKREEFDDLVKSAPDWVPKDNGQDAPPWNDEAPPPQDASEPLPFIDMSRWDIEKVPEQDWTVLNRFPRRQTVLFSGEGSTGKSTIELQLCAAHALARDWLGTMPEPGPSIFIDAEDDEAVMHRRLAAIAKHYGATFADLISGGLNLVSLAGKDAVLATVTRGGKMSPTPLYEQILQAAGEIKPVMIGLASSANFFAGNEIDRSHMQQFIGLTTRLAIAANGTCVLISHPSQEGIKSDSGTSGSTQWHNAVRARFFMKGIKPENGEQADSDLREIVFKKNNYGPISESLVLRYRDGLFLPVAGVSSLDQAAQEARAEDLFLTLLRRFTADNRFVSDKHGPNYAPAKFAKEDEAKRAGLVGSKPFEAAMRKLFKAGIIWNEPYGRPSRPNYRIALKPRKETENESV
jgi:RecA-family ATPase